MENLININTIRDLIINVLASTLVFSTTFFIKKKFPKIGSDILSLISGLTLTSILVGIYIAKYYSQPIKEFLIQLIIPLGISIIVSILIWVVFSSNNLPDKLDFPFLFFCAIVNAFLGGAIWNSLFHGTLGGALEPHWVKAFFWPVITNLPGAITLVILNLNYNFIEIRQQTVLYIIFFFIVAISSLTFYDFPIHGNVGFRRYLDANNWSFFEKEFLLVVIWSSLLSIPIFSFVGLVKILVVPWPKIFQVIILSFLKQTGLCIGLTTSAVLFFLLVYPNQPNLDAARGIIAGVALRVALFFGLFIGSHMK